MQVTGSQLTALRTNAKKTVATASRASLDLSRVVWQIRNARVKGDPETRPWQHWGYTSWEEYLRAELQMSVDTAINHLRIWEVFGIALKGRWRIQNVLPYSKMALLSMTALKVKDVNDLLTKNMGKSIAEIKAVLRAGRTGVSTPVNLTTSTLTASYEWLDEYLQHLATIRLALGPYSRAEVVMIALRYFVKNAPEIRGLTPKKASAPALVPAKKKATPKKKPATRASSKKGKKS